MADHSRINGANQITLQPLLDFIDNADIKRYEKNPVLGATLQAVIHRHPDNRITGETLR